MGDSVLNILEILLFFIAFPFVFQAFNAFDTSKIFKKGFVWQIQILYIFGVCLIYSTPPQTACDWWRGSNYQHESVYRLFSHINHACP